MIDNEQCERCQERGCELTETGVHGYLCRHCRQWVLDLNSKEDLGGDWVRGEGFLAEDAAIRRQELRNNPFTKRIRGER